MQHDALSSCLGGRVFQEDRGISGGQGVFQEDRVHFRMTGLGQKGEEVFQENTVRKVGCRNVSGGQG